ncbi:MAG: HpcH/HpaI aldolase/citrate lyase family protein [Nitrospirota bacterium]
MKKRKLKERLQNKELTVGSWITIGHTSIAEIMANAGFDWLTVDMEHSVITLRETQQLIQVIELSGVTPIVRVGENDPALIKRVMDAGAHGVIVPMVNSREEAQKAVQSVKYPPEGFRGVGLARAQAYGAGFDQYKEWLKNESIVIVQIEHIKGVENLEKILGTPGVDGFIIGPYDLSGSLGVPGEFDHPDVIKALNHVKEVTHKLEALSGFHVIPPDYRIFKEKMDDGYRFIAFSLDFLFLGDNCRVGVKEIRALKTRKE